MQVRPLPALFALLALVSAPLSAHECIHGFWIFGHDHIYLSHKPEIGSLCHGYQVILEVTLEGEGAKRYGELEANHGELTVEFPKSFMLDDIREGAMMPVNATLHDGNFEEKVLPHHVVCTEIPVRVVRKIVYRKLDAQKGRSGEVQAFLFGTPEETYLANRVDQNPDFDQVVQVEVRPEHLLGVPPIKDSGAPTLGKTYSLTGHTFSADGKPNAFLRSGETGFLQGPGGTHPFLVVRKVELTMSADAFAASH